MNGQNNASCRIIFFIISLILSTSLVGASAAHAKSNRHKTASKKEEKYASLIVDASTGAVLHQENAGKFRYPASLTKMMTLYLTFEALERGKLKMEQSLPVSAYAASRPRMNMNLRKGERLTVKEAILCLIVRSANDASVVLAEAIAGSESNFAQLMTERARHLGMDNTVFRNASGLPDPAQKTTAYDLARLAIALKRDYPQYYSLFARTEFVFRGRVLEGHNKVTRHYPGADGLKTGFVNASGFNLVTSAARGNTRLIGVVMGGSTAQSRDRKMISLLDRYFGSNGKTTKVANVSDEEAASNNDGPIVKVANKKQKVSKKRAATKAKKSKKLHETAASNNRRTS